MTRFALAACAVLAAAGPARAVPSLDAVSPAVGQRGTTFTLSLTGEGLADPQGLLFYGSGVVCTKLAAVSATEVRATLQAAAACRLGEHPFRLRTKAGVSELRTFRVTPFRVVAETDADHDTAETAQLVPTGVSVAGALEPEGADYYAVKLKKGDRLAAEVEGVRLGAARIDPLLVVAGPDGKELARADDTPLFRQDPFVTLVAPADGTYTLAVRDAAGTDGGRYVLHVGSFLRPAAIFPAGGQAGKTVRVRLLGDAGGERTQEVKLPPTADPRFELYPGEGAAAAPTPHPFRVSAFPDVTEAEPNDDPERATAATGWPVAFNGVIDKPGDRDHYRFPARRGERIEVQAFASRIGSPLDTVVAIFGPGGKLVASNDDDETHDSRVCFTAPADGRYTVRISDKRSQGGPLFVYRIEVDKPRPELAVFLPGPARKSQAQQVILVPRGGRTTALLAVRRTGFDGAVSLTASDLPKGVRLKADAIAPDEYLVPVVFEADADAPLGGGLAGLSGRGGDATAPVTGGFTQVVPLVRGPGDSALHSVTVSRLAIAVVEPAPFTLTLTPPAAALSADGSLEVKVKVTREKGMTAPVEVRLPLLPHGVEGPGSVVVAADKAEAVFLLTAREDLAPGAWKLVASGTAGAPAARDPLEGTPAFGGGGRRPRRARAGTPAVGSEPVTLRLTAPPVKGEIVAATVEQGKDVRVVCRLTTKGPAGAFTATLEGLPPRVTAAPVKVDGKTKEIAFVVKVSPTAPVGTHPSLVCVLSGEAGGQKVVHRAGRNGTFKIAAPGGAAAGPDGKPLSPLEALRRRENAAPPGKP